MMAMHELMLEIDRQAGKKSLIHRVDTRIMIVFVIIMIIYAVFITDLVKLILLELFVLSLMVIAHLEPTYLIKRLALIFPFGGFIAVMQPFIRDGEIIYSWWVFNISRQGLDFGILLLMKMTVCVSAVILLSSVSTLPEIFNGMKKLRVPRFFITTLNMMVRYLYLFYENLHRIRVAQKCRGFTIKNHPRGYKFVLRNFADTISTIFIKSYDQGERVFTSMLARGYNMDSDYLYTEDRPVRRADYFLFVGFGVIVIMLELMTLPGLIFFM
jgi:cobalt/nickel transport system permease protein